MPIAIARIKSSIRSNKFTFALTADGVTKKRLKNRFSGTKLEDKNQKRNAGRPSFWPNQKTVKLGYKGPQELEQRIEAKVDELIESGIPRRIANKSNLQRLCVEHGIDTIEEIANAKPND